MSRAYSKGSLLADFDAASACSSPTSSVKIKNTFLHFEEGEEPRGVSARPLGSHVRSNSETFGLSEDIMGRLSPRVGAAAPEVLVTGAEGIDARSYYHYPHDLPLDFVMSVEVDPPRPTPRALLPQPPRPSPGSGLYGGVPGSGHHFYNAEVVPDGLKTTVMLRNIPNKYTRRMLLDRLIEGGFEGTFDFLYLPIDVRNLCNMGYAFVNFFNPAVVVQYDCKFP
jgi:hypothetical protein